MTCHDNPKQVSVQSNILFQSCHLKNFKMAGMMAIQNVGLDLDQNSLTL